MEEDDKSGKMDSPTNSQQTVSDDDEIDYSIKPEFYDSELDIKDELWVQKKRKGRVSDAVLSCPACFTTLCLECQRHEKYVTQYRAVFVVNCKIENDQVREIVPKPKAGKRSRESNDSEVGFAADDSFKSVCCSICSTQVGAIDEDEVYHFFNVLPISASSWGVSLASTWRIRVVKRYDRYDSRFLGMKVEIWIMVVFGSNPTLVVVGDFGWELRLFSSQVQVAIGSCQDLYNSGWVLCRSI